MTHSPHLMVVISLNCPVAVVEVEGRDLTVVVVMQIIVRAPRLEVVAPTRRTPMSWSIRGSIISLGAGPGDDVAVDEQRRLHVALRPSPQAR